MFFPLYHKKIARRAVFSPLTELASVVLVFVYLKFVSSFHFGLLFSTHTHIIWVRICIVWYPILSLFSTVKTHWRIRAGIRLPLKTSFAFSLYCVLVWNIRSQKREANCGCDFVEEFGRRSKTPSLCPRVPYEKSSDWDFECQRQTKSRLVRIST